MSCCGEAATTPLNERHRMRVRYVGGRPIEVKGPATGQAYFFSGLDRLQLVDPRDAIVIARDRSFRIEGIVELPLEKAS